MGEREQFCGWYFKCRSDEESIAFIPAVHSSQGKRTASIQLISSNDYRNFAFPAEQGCLSWRKPYAKLGGNVFSETGLTVDLHTDGFSAVGELYFGQPRPLRSDIMGPFCGVPFMECRHRVFSMRHTVNGELRINGRTLRFDNGEGYIEGDKGRSFPKRYLWTQCGFAGGSLFLSAADIPLGPAHFTGMIGIVQIGEQEYRLATYLGAKAELIKDRRIVVRQGKFTMLAESLDDRAFSLKAPQSGAMTRTIRENIAGRAHYVFYRGEQCLLDLTSDAASFEYEYP